MISSLTPFNKTVAGSTTFHLAQDFPGRIFKPAHPNEKIFYEGLKDHPQLKRLVPKYHGTLTYNPSTVHNGNHSEEGDNNDNNNNNDNNSSINNSSNGNSNHHILAPTTASIQHSEYLVLDDLTFHYSFPCIADIKLGTTHHDIDFTAPSVPLRKSKYLTASSLGFCLCGMQIYNPNKDSYYEFMDKEEGRELTETTVVNKLSHFFMANGDLRKEIIVRLIDRLQQVAAYFETKPEFTFRSTSLLLVYEAKPGAEAKIDVKMIDFAHAKRLSTELNIHFNDQYGYLFGTKNLINILKTICGTPPLLEPISLSSASSSASSSSASSSITTLPSASCSIKISSSAPPSTTAPSSTISSSASIVPGTSTSVK
eukprot:TRINITY_DN1814_c0_g1_i2.p1 TRINITY_DN1814_c0_g1~~TRINITY_DN1814_c0_g1_i2.p1  ORF type:complete len:369 (+),score=116.04 TRINITY_DN1814_c0_g1_i2:139-1245(+)